MTTNHHPDTCPTCGAVRGTEERTLRAVYALPPEPIGRKVIVLGGPLVGETFTWMPDAESIPGHPDVVDSWARLLELAGPEGVEVIGDPPDGTG